MSEELKRLVAAVDVVVWAHAVKRARKAGSKMRVDFEGAMLDLAQAYTSYINSQYEVILSGDKPKDGE